MSDSAASAVASRIRFGTDGWRAVIARDYTIDNLSRVTEALTRWLFEQSEAPSVALGYDCRFNGRLFARYVASQLAHHGVRVLLSPDYVSTPMVSLATERQGCTAGVVLTASHNPPEYGGFKLKGPFGGPAFVETIAEVEALIPDVSAVVEDRLEHWHEAGRVAELDMEQMYVDHIRRAFDLNQLNESRFRIGYDAMYGAGQRAMQTLFPGAHFMHCSYNPSFEGQAPEPIEKNLQPFQALVKQHGIHFALATDGDADRIGLFDERGVFIDSHHIIALLIHFLAGHKKQTGKVVCTFSCSRRIHKLAEHYGLPLEITKVGFKYIGAIMTQEPVLVGGEESGGIAIAGHIPERDGIFIGLTILEMMVAHDRTLSELIDEIYALVGPFAVRRNDLHLEPIRKDAVVTACRDEVYQHFGPFEVESVETIDGFKFHLGNDTWVMIRPSGTEPVLRVYAEGRSPDEAQAILDATTSTILGR